MLLSDNCKESLFKMCSLLAKDTFLTSTYVLHWSYDTLLKHLYDKVEYQYTNPKWSCRYEIKSSYDPHSCECNFSNNWVEEPEKFRTLMGLNSWFVMLVWHQPTKLWNHGWTSDMTAVMSSNPPLKYWIFQASLCNGCWSCIHSCGDRRFTWFLIRSSIYDSFHVSFRPLMLMSLAVESNPYHIGGMQ